MTCSCTHDKHRHAHDEYNCFDCKCGFFALPSAEPTDEERHALTMEVLNDPCSWPKVSDFGLDQLTDLAFLQQQLLDMQKRLCSVVRDRKDPDLADDEVYIIQPEDRVPDQGIQYIGNLSPCSECGARFPDTEQGANALWSHCCQ